LILRNVWRAWYVFLWVSSCTKARSIWLSLISRIRLFVAARLCCNVMKRLAMQVFWPLITFCLIDLIIDCDTCILCSVFFFCSYARAVRRKSRGCKISYSAVALVDRRCILRYFQDILVYHISCVAVLWIPCEFPEKYQKGRDRIAIREMVLMKMLQSVTCYKIYFGKHGCDPPMRDLLL